MLGTTEKIVMYYFGVGFVVLLTWGIFLPVRQLDETTARRYLRWTPITALAGLLHPAVAVAARDIVTQVGHELPDGNDDLQRRQTRASTATNTLAIVSIVPVLALLVIASL